MHDNVPGQLSDSDSRSRLRLVSEYVTESAAELSDCLYELEGSISVMLIGGDLDRGVRVLWSPRRI